MLLVHFATDSWNFEGAGFGRANPLRGKEKRSTQSTCVGNLLAAPDWI